MAGLGLKYTDSFQSERTIYRAEDPLEEAWARIAQLGSGDFVRSIFKPEHPNN